MEVVITKENFEEEVLKSPIPVLVDFWATWCGPCMMLSPIIEELANEYEGKIKVGKVNTDEQEELAIEFKVMAIPTLFLFKDGKVIKQLSGYRGKDELVKELGL